jgi:hypothetical protein
MALTPQTWLHSLYGKKFALDKDGFAVGTPGIREPIETSTAASTLANSGVSLLGGTTATWTLQGAAAPGVRKTILHASTDSTAVLTVKRGSSLISIIGATGGDPIAATVNLTYKGTALNLIAISTLEWMLASARPSTLLQSMSTSS